MDTDMPCLGKFPRWAAARGFEILVGITFHFGALPCFSVWHYWVLVGLRSSRERLSVETG